MKKPKRLNVQGLARKEPLLMKCILPDTGNVLVSIDLSAGEPTVTSEFSRDKNYIYATFEGVGKTPFYKDDVLKIDDLYLTVASVSPVGRDEIKANFNYIQDMWLKDPEAVKSKLGKTRKLHKMGALGIGYSMGPKKMVRQFNDAGFKISLKEAQEFHKEYWDLFAGIKRLSDRLTKQVQIDGYLINPFGYRMTPDPRKAFNYFIQSSVSAIMHVFGMKLFAAAPWARLITVIHDEFIVEIPKDRVEEFRIAKELATASLNEDLKWSVDIRTGFVVGSNWYDAK